jgi:hypothetical protein
MERHRTIVSISAAVSLLAGLSALAPPAALAGGPLLSGYGGPGAGAQSIIGATLLNGPSGGSGGGGSGGSGGLSSSSGGNASPSGTSSGAGTASNATAGGGSGPAAHAHRAAHTPGSTAAHPHSGFVQSSTAGGGGASASLPGTMEAAAVSAGSPWFSGGDLLALVLAAGMLALMAVATARLARAHHE